MSEAKSFRLRVALRNNRLIRAREELGYATATAAARAFDLSNSTLTSYETFRNSPWETDGAWKESALKIADAYGRHPSELWTDDMRAVRQTRAEIEVDAPPTLALDTPATPEQLVDGAEERARLAAALDALPYLARRMVRARYGLDDGGEERTFAEVGAEVGLSTARAQQIVRRAEGRLRDLMECAEGNAALPARARRRWWEQS